MNRIAYICDGKQCKDCVKSRGCTHTTDVAHAKNFKKLDADSYWEVDCDDKSVTITIVWLVVLTLLIAIWITWFTLTVFGIV